jgi:hypothetical protein
LNPFTNILNFVFIPVAFFIISGSALLGNRLVVRSKTQKGFRFKQSVVIGAKKKEGSKNQKKIIKGSQSSSKPKLEFGMHTCPAHGVEKCAGNYLDLHSCNSPSQTGKQLFWKEITTPAPALNVS